MYNPSPPTGEFCPAESGFEASNPVEFSTTEQGAIVRSPAGRYYVPNITLAKQASQYLAL